MKNLLLLLSFLILFPLSWCDITADYCTILEPCQACPESFREGLSSLKEACRETSSYEVVSCSVDNDETNSFYDDNTAEGIRTTQKYRSCDLGYVSADVQKFVLFELLMIGSAFYSIQFIRKRKKFDYARLSNLVTS
eukprot:maker-scaffold_11-snap-gene-7.2-mRNA-1 protein AED:0.00 eAED:0.00 QI:71/1/1/1/1/1/2/66/136